METKSKSAFLGTKFGICIFLILFLNNYGHFDEIPVVIYPAILLNYFLADTHTFEIKEGSLFAGHMFFFSRKMQFSDIDEISVMPVYGYLPFRPYNLEITSANTGKKIRPMLAHIKNGDTLTEAIIHEARKVNPNVLIDPSLLSKYKL